MCVYQRCLYLEDSQQRENCDIDVCFTEADEEAFEDNPDEYIRRDIEGSGQSCLHHYDMGL